MYSYKNPQTEGQRKNLSLSSTQQKHKKPLPFRDKHLPKHFTLIKTINMLKSKNCKNIFKQNKKAGL